MFYLGLDLGKQRDFSALAVVEAMPHGYFAVRHLERAALGTPYTRVVKRVADVTRHPALRAGCYLTVDATGVGVAVVESLRTAEMSCRGMTGVTITGGDRARQLMSFGGLGEHWSVPRVDLLGKLQVMLERGELKIAKGMAETGALVRELTQMRRSGSGSGSEHDDLVLAVALACWQATRGKVGLSTQRLVGI